MQLRLDGERDPIVSAVGLPLDQKLVPFFRVVTLTSPVSRVVCLEPAWPRLVPAVLAWVAARCMLHKRPQWGVYVAGLRILGLLFQPLEQLVVDVTAGTQSTGGSFLKCHEPCLGNHQAGRPNPQHCLARAPAARFFPRGCQLAQMMLPIFLHFANFAIRTMSATFSQQPSSWSAMTDDPLGSAWK